MAYTPPPPPQPYLPNVVWARPAVSVPSRADLASVASTPADTQAQVVAENAPIRIVYGAVRIGAQIADVLVHQGRLVVLAVWCQGEIAAISAVTLDDAALPAGVSATHYTGAAGQGVDATLAAAYAAQGITYEDTLPGVAYSVFRVDAGASAGVPQFAATIRGLRVYDPRTTATAWSANPALCLADFLASDDYGWGRTVDWATVESAADACDEPVGTGARRSMGLCLDTVQACDQWAEALRAYAGCWLAPGPSGWRLIADRPAASVRSFTAADIRAGSMRLRKLGRAQAPTVVSVRYTDTSVTPWAERSATAYAAGVETGSTARRESSVPLPGIQTYAQAYREAVERLNHFQLEDLEATWETWDEALALEVGDVVTVTHPVGLTGKLMRITALDSRSAGRWTISAREYDAAAYSDTVQAEPSSPDTDLPSPAAPPALTGLAAVEEIYQLDNGTWASRLAVTWDDPGYAYLSAYRVEVYRLGVLVVTATAREPVYRTPAVQEGVEYVVKVAVVSGIGSVGEWAQANVTPAGKYLVPGNVPSVSAFESGGRVYVSWSAAVDLDIWRYEVRYGPTGGDWSSATLLDRVDALRLQSDQIPVGTWDVHVKALDSVGQYSANAASVEVTVTSDAAAFLVDSYDSDSPTLTNMASYTLGRTDPAAYYVTEDGATVASKFGSALTTYTDALATYHGAVTSTWLGEAEDFGQLLGGQWTGSADVAALSGAIASSLGFSDDGSAWAYSAGLSHKTNARFARMKHEATGSATLHVTVPTQNIRLDAVPREEVGTGTSSASGPVTITLDNDYVAVKRLTITPEGTTARSATYDNVVVGDPTSFDVYVFDTAGNKIASAFRWQFQGV